MKAYRIEHLIVKCRIIYFKSDVYIPEEKCKEAEKQNSREQFQGNTPLEGPRKVSK